MAFTAVVVPFQLAAATGSGTLDITSSGFGTPQALQAVLSGSPNDSTTPVGDALLSIGYTDGAVEWCYPIFAQDALPSANTARVLSVSSVIVELDGSSIEGKMSFNSWISDGVRLNYDAAFDQAYRGYVVLFNGAANVEAKGFVYTLDNDTEAFTFTGACAPDLMFGGLVQGTYSVGHASDIYVSHSVACRGAADEVTQFTTGWYNDDGAGNVGLASHVTTTDFCGYGNNNSWARAAAITAWGSNGFTIGRTTGAESKDLSFHALAIELPAGQSALCGLGTTPTSATTKSIPTDYPSGDDDSVVVGFFPTIATGDHDKTGSSECYAVGAADSSGNQAAVVVSDDDASPDSVAKSAFLDSACLLAKSAGSTAEYTADITNMTGGDIDLNFSEKTDATAYRFGWWAIQAGEAAGGINIAAAGVASAFSAGAPAGLHRGIAATGLATAFAAGDVLAHLTIEAAGVATGEAAGVATVEIGTLFVSALGVPSAGSIGDAAIDAGQSLIIAEGVPSAAAFGAGLLRGLVAATGVTTGEAVGDPQLDISISPTGTTAAFAAGVVDLAQLMVTSGEGSGFGAGTTAVVGEGTYIQPTSAVTSFAAGDLAIDIDSIIQAAAVSSGFAAGTLQVARVIETAGVASGEQTPAPVLVLEIAPSGVPSGETIGTAELLSTLQISATGSASGFSAGITVVLGGLIARELIVALAAHARYDIEVTMDWLTIDIEG